MSYLDIAHMTESEALVKRVTACAAQQGNTHSELWTAAAIWLLCALPGWGDSWAYATAAGLAAGGADMGSNSAVITDATILAGVAHVMQEHPSLVLG